jgi:hypothetical protein
MLDRRYLALSVLLLGPLRGVRPSTVWWDVSFVFRSIAAGDLERVLGRWFRSRLPSSSSLRFKQLNDGGYLIVETVGP